MTEKYGDESEEIECAYWGLREKRTKTILKRVTSCVRASLDSSPAYVILLNQKTDELL